ncbi:MAG: methyltransferase domain-containing protein [Deltaproteobacteria bacterium]|jgi:2-polyprenyl-3-methyl-5-hydroxy-6-metoxy-1,4-benzoquinol methylase|nr:methyltransferase domain-containing protein [Deltaproteobacteria bacterium]
MSPAPDWLKDKKSRLERKNAFDGALVYGTAKFNRETGRGNAAKNPFQEYVDPDTGMIRPDLVRPRSCPVCGEPPGPGLFIKGGFRHVRCPSCGLIYVSLILREDVMLRYWRDELAWMSVLNSGPQEELDRLKFAYGLDAAGAWLEGRAPGKLLDMGAGNGTFVRTANSMGWKATALEINTECAEAMLNEGFQVIVKPLELSDLPHGSFDLVTFWEVLEHLAEPRLALSRVAPLFNEGGVLLVMVPNAGSLVTRILHEKSNTFGGHSHLNHFDAGSLARLLESLGYQILEMETLLTELGAINNHLDFQDPYLGEAASFASDLTPELIHDRMWGSRLFVIARRKPGA